ncbi:hypothetical protein P3X46_016346 [Hevea brasiliensis]|uniref:Uncharacterized protein n=1 Tax=Hevea brasiliensis TaxID=3981 RepID=A0ABQ9M2S7_HEVBR|nr:hypothetical protein P3X46_016346 [Hevea brasiliensis]
MKAFLITCILLSSFLLIPSPTVARELAHNGEVGGHKAEVKFENDSVTDAGRTGNPVTTPACKPGSKGSGNCKCPVFKPKC